MFVDMIISNVTARPISEFSPYLSDQDDPCYFFQQFKKNRFLSNMVTTDRICESDLDGLCYERTGPNEFCVVGFSVMGIGFFNTVSILKTRFGSIIEMTSFDTACFDNAGAYFDTYTKGRISGFHKRPKEKNAVKCKRVKRAILYGKRVDCSILQCVSYGCKVMLTIQ